MGRDWRRQPARQEGVEGAALIGDRRPELAGGGFGLDSFGIRAVFAPYRQFGRTPRVPQRFGLSCERSHTLSLLACRLQHISDWLFRVVPLDCHFLLVTLFILFSFSLFYLFRFLLFPLQKPLSANSHSISLRHLKKARGRKHTTQTSSYLPIQY